MRDAVRRPPAGGATGWRAANGIAHRLGLPAPEAWQGGWAASDGQGAEGMARDGS
ncbi:hypothetical protein [Ancylobacter oerskovii]|uniref:Uncharacterized protein n=1 Tax=Ancylobacter oerskovii TaxID=459519 RepID=A0ABW4Z6B2_9HYPH